jgi:hypothetical protein
MAKKNRAGQSADDSPLYRPRVTRVTASMPKLRLPMSGNGDGTSMRRFARPGFACPLPTSGKLRNLLSKIVDNDNR